MRLSMIRKVILRTHKGTSIKSFNLISGEKITAPEYSLKEVTDEGEVIFIEKGCQAEGNGDMEIATDVSMIASITYFPPKNPS